MTTEYSGRSGRLLVPPFGRPLISSQVPPALLVRKTCRDGEVSASTAVIPGNTATTSSALAGSTATAATPWPLPPGWLGGRFQVGGFAVSAFLVNCRVPSPKPNQIVFESRSEEHTSELQSLTNLVCRLLLEKKKWNGRE